MAMEFTDKQFEELLATIGSNRARGSLMKCSVYYAGDKEPDVLDVFLAHVDAYKNCERITDSEALNAIHYLLKGDAALWWEGVKDSVKDWREFLIKIRHAFAPKKPAYILYEEIMSTKQLNDQRTEDFVAKKRLLFSQLPNPGHPECQQIDMVYWLLKSAIKNAIPRPSIYSFEGLVERAREIEKSSKVKTSENNSKKKRRQGSRCNFCRMHGHTAEVCLRKKKKIVEEDLEKPAAATKQRSNDLESPESPPPQFVVKCYGCGAPGIVRSKCPDCKHKMKPSAELLKNISFC